MRVPYVGNEDSRSITTTTQDRSATARPRVYGREEYRTTTRWDPVAQLLVVPTSSGASGNAVVRLGYDGLRARAYNYCCRCIYYMIRSNG